MLLRTTMIGVVLLAAGANGQGPRPGGPGAPGWPSRFLGAEAGMPGRVVKNAPYSADVVTESTQTLGDGNRIHQTTTTRVYRDSDGRTRREPALNNLGGLSNSGNLPQLVFINDPMAGLNYTLNATERTAVKSAWSRPPVPRQTSSDAVPGPGRGFGPRPRGGPNAENAKTESLGRQTIEGVLADGTRTTVTIPAGQIGNEQPIQTVNETWYSQELQTTLLSRRTDPRFGETVTRLQNVSRAEPSRSLFEPPVDYKLSERGPGPRQ